MDTKHKVSLNCILNNTRGVAILSITTVSCCLSVIGVIAILYSYARWRNIRDNTRLLLVFLTIADLLTAVGYLIGSVALFNIPQKKLPTNYHNSAECVLQSFITIFSSMASFFWTVALAFHIFCRLVYGTTYMHRKIGFRFVFVFCWGVPAVISMASLMSNVLGANWESTGPWCWIKSGIKEDKMVLWMILSGKGWEFLCYLVSAHLYIFAKLQMYLQLRRRRNQTQPEDENQPDNQPDSSRTRDLRDMTILLYLLMALYLLRVWGSVRFVINILSDQPQREVSCVVQYVLLVLQSYGDCGQGFWNFIIFCCSDRVVRSRLFSCCCRRTDEPSDNERRRLLREERTQVND